MVRSVIFRGMLFLVSVEAHAMITPIFKQDGSQATILFAGMPGDPDPSDLYDSLAISPEDFQGKWAKRVAVPASDGSKALDIDCVFSKAVQNNGSCTVIFHSSPGLIDVSPGEGRARLSLRGPAAAKLASLFVARPGSPVVFSSRDGRFTVLDSSSGGVITQLIVDWNGKGL